MQDDIDPRCLVEALTDDIETARLRRERPTGQAAALGGDMIIEALPTVYRGTTFRSALEASWAATLDSLAIGWEYEPETIALPSGAIYIPDFWLPELGTWLEVKGTGVPRIEKAIELGKARACQCDPPCTCTCNWPHGELVIIGHPPVAYQLTEDDFEGHTPYWVLAKRVRRHGGHLKWSASNGRAAWLIRCPDCLQTGWITSGCCRACRGPLAGGHAHRSGDSAFRFIRISGYAASDPEQDEAA